MTGQDAVRIAQGFHDAPASPASSSPRWIGDARGGAALSIYGVTHAPIKVHRGGREARCLEPFLPHRLAGRILQQGDILSPVEKAQSTVDEKEAERLAKKVQSKKGMDLATSSTLCGRCRDGALKNVLGMLPGINPAMLHPPSWMIKAQACLGIVLS